MEQIKINIRTKNCDLTPELRNRITEKVNGFNKLMNLSVIEEAVADVEIQKQFGEHHKKGEIFQAEINLRYDGDLYRSKATQFDIMTALDEVVGEISRQLKRKKNKKNDLLRRGRSKVKNLLKFGK